MSATARGHFDLILAGSSGPNEIHISLSPNGRTYEIESSSVLEAGGDVCANPPEDPDELECEATAIDSFAFNGGAGDDVVVVGRNVPAPATLRGGAGNDTGNDALFGGPGEDNLSGGRGKDICIGGAGRDTARSCEVVREIP